jgi:hypothetical protein
MNLTHSFAWRAAALAVLSIAVAGCSKEAPAPKVDTPALVLAPATEKGAATDVLTTDVVAGGIASAYQASFKQNQLEEIRETRRFDTSPSAEGRYEFYGARLTKYSGAPLQSAATAIELEFDLRGALIKSHSDAGKVSAEEITAIRGRAQLLRSHALAQRSAHEHASR